MQEKDDRILRLPVNLDKLVRGFWICLINLLALSEVRSDMPIL